MEIIPCQRNLETHSPVVGLLIRYRNGDQACIGQFRFDCASTPLVIDRVQRLCLGFARTPSRRPYVSKVTQGPSSKEEDGIHEWIELPRTGRVDWWFTDIQCQVICPDQASLKLL